MYVASGADGVGTYDLATRTAITTPSGAPVIDAPADAVAVDQDSHQLFIATAQGVISSVDTTQLDALRGNASAPIAAPQQLADITDLAGSIQSITAG